MRRFRFPLQRLLRLRAHEERRARRAYGMAVAELGLIEQRAATVERDLKACRDQAAGTGPERGLAEALAGGFEFRRRRLQAERRRAEAVVEAARVDYRARRQELRSLTRLRERRHQEWRAASLAAEQAQLEELARVQRAVQGTADRRRP